MSEVELALNKIEYEIKRLLAKSDEYKDDKWRFSLEHNDESWAISSGFVMPRIYVDIDRIKEKGLKLDSPLLWALLPGWANYIFNCPISGWQYTDEKPIKIENAVAPTSSFYWDVERICTLGGNIYLKINYTGDWKDSLTKRPVGC